MAYEFDGIPRERKTDMQAARRARYLKLVSSDMNFTQAARMVGVSKHTGRAWHNGRTKFTGKNEKPSVDRYRGDMDEPKRIDGRCLDPDERIAITDMRREAGHARHRNCHRQVGERREQGAPPEHGRHRRSIRPAPRAGHAATGGRAARAFVNPWS